MLSRGLEQIQDLFRYRFQLLGARPLDYLKRVNPVDEHGETAMEVAAPVVALEQLLVEVMTPFAVADPKGAQRTVEVRRLCGVLEGVVRHLAVILLAVPDEELDRVSVQRKVGHGVVARVCFG